MEGANFETRVLLLEKEMEWNRGDMQSFKGDLHALKEGQDKLHMDLRDFSVRTNERISSLQAHMEERISTLQAHTDERISSLQAHTDAGFVEVHREFADVHREISGLHGALSSLHGAIANQTRWILAALLTMGTMISFGLPVVLKLVDRLVP